MIRPGERVRRVGAPLFFALPIVLLGMTACLDRYVAPGGDSDLGDGGGDPTDMSYPTAGFPTGPISDHAALLSVQALIPTYSGTSIVSVSPEQEDLPLPMLHGTGAIDPTAYSACANCHINAPDGVYYPGNLHSSLANLAARAADQLHRLPRDHRADGLRRTARRRTPRAPRPPER